jgi:hypothetical protein
VNAEDVSSGGEAELVAVTLRGVDFGDDPLTTERLLQVMQREFEDRGVKQGPEDFQPRPWRDEVVEVSQLRHNHDSISHVSRDKRPFESLISELESRGPGWPERQISETAFLGLDVLEWPGRSGLISINNRRAYC